MKRMWIVLVTASLLGTAPNLAAQMRGGGGTGQSGGGMQGPSGQQGMGAAGQGMGGGMGRSGPVLTGEQRRAVMHTTQTQNKQYDACAQAMDKVRDRIRHMVGTKPGQSPDSQPSGQSADTQPSDGSDQLSSDLQDLEQDQNDFLESLNKDQKTALESQIKDVQKKLKQLDDASRELKADLEAKNADPAMVRKELKKLDHLSKAIQNEQRQIASALGIQS